MIGGNESVEQNHQSTGKRSRKRAKRLRRRVVALGSVALAVFAWFATPQVQDMACGWNPVERAQERWPDQVRGVCFKTANWTATPAEFTELADEFLVRASGNTPTYALELYSSADRPSSEEEEEFDSHWKPVNWAQRVSDLKQKGNTAEIRFERYDAEGSVPPRAMVRIRDAEVRVKFSDDGVLEIVSWSMRETIPGDAAPDGGIDLPRVLTVADTRGYVLPTTAASRGSLLPTEDTVRLICRLDAPDRDWTRTTDGWVPTQTLPDLNDQAPGLPECEPHHAERAAALEAASE
jgi:hypothetical protein